MSPEQIAIAIQTTETGCPSCQWYNWKHNTTGGKRCCDASQPAYPNGGKTVCGTWYKPKTRGGTGAGRVRNNGERGGVR